MNLADKEEEKERRKEGKGESPSQESQMAKEELRELREGEEGGRRLDKSEEIFKRSVSSILCSSSYLFHAALAEGGAVVLVELADVGDLVVAVRLLDALLVHVAVQALGQLQLRGQHRQRRQQEERPTLQRQHRRGRRKAAVVVMFQLNHSLPFFVGWSVRSSSLSDCVCFSSSSFPLRPSVRPFLSRQASLRE